MRNSLRQIARWFVSAVVQELLVHLAPGSKPAIVHILPGLVNGKVPKMALSILVSQTSQLSVVAKDRLGNVADVDGAPTFATSDATVANVDEDGTLTAVAPGTCRITASIDADLSEGVVPIVGTLEVVVSAGMAVMVEISAATPVDAAA